MTDFSPALQRWAAAFILLLILMLFYLYLILPIWQYYSMLFSDIRNSEEQLGRFQTLISTSEILESRYDAIENLDREADLFLPGAKSAIASANLREYISETVRASGSELVSSQEFDVESDEMLTPIGLQFSIKGEIEDLVDLIYSIETSRPVVLINELDVTSTSGRVIDGRTRRQSPESRDSRNLEVQFRVLGHMIGKEDPDAESVQ